MILSICGSLRQNSTSRALIREVARLLPGGSVVALPDLSDLPHFNPDRVEGSLRPEAVRRLDRQVEAAEGLVLASPEYASEIPGSLKNALDWLVSTTLLTGKPVLLLTTSASRSGKVQAALRVVLEMVEAQVIQGPDFHQSEIAPTGPLSPQTGQRVRQALQPLGEWIVRQRVRALEHCA